MYSFKVPIYRQCLPLTAASGRSLPQISHQPRSEESDFSTLAFRPTAILYSLFTILAKHFSDYSQLVARTWRHIQKFREIIKRQKSFQGLATCGYEVLMSLQFTNANRVHWITFYYVSYSMCQHLEISTCLVVRSLFKSSAHDNEWSWGVN
jgi:hypothetical protein